MASKGMKMNKQKLVVVLLIVAIVLSVLNLIVELGFDAEGFGPVGQTTTVIKGADADVAQVGFTKSVGANS